MSKDKISFRTALSKSWHSHDSAYKNLFGQKRIFIDLLKCILDSKEIENIDFSTLYREPTEHRLEKTGKTIFNDLIWSANDKNGQFIIFAPVEFQRKWEDDLPLRMINYFTSIALLAHKIVKERGKNEVPIVKQILIYNSDNDKDFLEIYKEYQHIKYFKQLQEFINKFCESVNIIKFNPRFDADNPDNFVKLIHNIEIYKNCEAETDLIIETLERLERNIPENDEYDLHRAFINLFRNGLFNDNNIVRAIAEAKNIQEAGKMIRDEFETWETKASRKIFNEGVTEGVTKGVTDTLINSVINVLEAKSFPVSDALKDFIKNEPVEKLNDLLTNAAVSSDIDDFCRMSNFTANPITPH